MRVFKEMEHVTLIASMLLSIFVLAGCATANKATTSIKYSYDTKASFAEQKGYAWAPSSGMYRKDLLLEANVQAYADQLLAQKGYTRMSAKPDLTIAISYEFEIGINEDNYQVRTLDLNIYRNESKGLVWRGTAFGTIKTDAASDDLKQAVQGILSNFPPKSL